MQSQYHSLCENCTAPAELSVFKILKRNFVVDFIGAISTLGVATVTSPQEEFSRENYPAIFCKVIYAFYQLHNFSDETEPGNLKMFGSGIDFRVITANSAAEESIPGGR